jgi:hypothetical protein
MGRLISALIRRSGFPMTSPARRGFRYLAQYYPPFYYGGYIEKIAGFQTILRTADETAIPGDVAECGVGRGLTLFMLGHFLARAGSPRLLYGFDSFEGFPAPTAADESPRRPVRGDLWSDTSLAHVRDHFVRSSDLEGFLRDKVRLVPGFFSATLPLASEPATIALLNLDVDLYESYRDCLHFLGPRVRGAIVYDEYLSPKWPGATQAVDEALPVLHHEIFYSPAMERHVSLPAASLGQAFAEKLIDRLSLRPVR